VIRVYDKAGNVIETREHKGDFKEFQSYTNRETVRVRLYYLEGMGSLSVEEILAAGGPLKNKKKKKGKTGEKAFLSRVRGKWTGFRSRAAFGRSDRNWNSWNWDWTGRQLRLSPFRIRVLSQRGVLLPATRLWVLRRTVIRLASRA
jgi:hypothetical protein